MRGRLSALNKALRFVCGAEVTAQHNSRNHRVPDAGTTTVRSRLHTASAPLPTVSCADDCTARALLTLNGVLEAFLAGAHVNITLLQYLHLTGRFTV